MDGKAQVPARNRRCPPVASLPPCGCPPCATRRAELYQLLKDLGQIETGQQPSEQALIVVAPLATT